MTAFMLALAAVIAALIIIAVRRLLRSIDATFDALGKRGDDA